MTTSIQKCLPLLSINVYWVMGTSDRTFFFPSTKAFVGSKEKFSMFWKAPKTFAIIGDKKKLSFQTQKLYTKYILINLNENVRKLKFLFKLK